MKTILASALFCILALNAAAHEPAAHPAWNVEACVSCHTAPAEKARLESRVARPCRDMCVSCHSMKNHHPVGVKIDAAVKAPLMLTADGTNTCVTCHDVTRKPTEDMPWTSQSAIQRVVRRSKEHKTFLLVMRNDHGQLCRNCH
jgi:hypothetical protein